MLVLCRIGLGEPDGRDTWKGDFTGSINGAAWIRAVVRARHQKRFSDFDYGPPVREYKLEKTSFGRGKIILGKVSIGLVWDMSTMKASVTREI